MEEGGGKPRHYVFVFISYNYNDRDVVFSVRNAHPTKGWQPLTCKHTWPAAATMYERVEWGWRGNEYIRPYGTGLFLIFVPGTEVPRYLHIVPTGLL